MGLDTELFGKQADDDADWWYSFGREAFNSHQQPLISTVTDLI